MKKEEEKKAADYTQNINLVLQAQSGDEKALEEIIKINTGLVRSIALRFAGRGIETEDLIQIGSIGMLKAVKSFDAGRGCVFSTYAVPLIMGEIRRFLRDDGAVKVARPAKRLGAILLKERERYIAETGREPGIEEMAVTVGVEKEEAAAALAAAYPVYSIYDRMGNDEDSPLVEEVLTDAAESERTFDRIALSEALSRMPPTWRKIVMLRYFRDLSQQKTARILSLSQVKVSREEKKIMEFLKKQLE